MRKSAKSRTDCLTFALTHRQRCNLQNIIEDDIQNIQKIIKGKIYITKYGKFILGDRPFRGIFFNITINSESYYRREKGI